jgi:hypothetical protein
MTTYEKWQQFSSDPTKAGSFEEFICNEFDELQSEIFGDDYGAPETSPDIRTAVTPSEAHKVPTLTDREARALQGGTEDPAEDPDAGSSSDS